MRALSERLKLRLQTEATVENHLKKRVKVLKGLAIKMMLLPGWPDRLVFLPGGVLMFFELKRPVGGKFEPRQERRHTYLRELGFTVIVARTKAEVDEALGIEHADT